MQQTNSNKHEKLMDMDETKPGTSVNPPKPNVKLSFQSLKECVDQFYKDVDYESRTGYKRGYACTVGEDFTNIDLLCNMYELVYDYCTSVDENILSKTDKKNFRLVCDGIRSINKGLTQYNNKQLDKVLISTMLGYILKITRNYFHD